jgi:hypothetical protein
MERVADHHEWGVPVSSTPIVITQDPTIVIAQDDPAVTMVVPITNFSQNKTGVSLSSPLAASTDFDTVTTAGFYYTIDALSTNTPVVGHVWYLNVMVDGNDPTSLIQQASFQDVGGSTWYRWLVGGSWGSWQQIVLLDASGRLPAVDGSQLTNVNVSVSTVIKNYLSGLTITPTGGSSSFSVAAGVANDTTNATTMVLASAMSKTTSTWSAGNGNGSLDTGSIANTTWYNVFLISNAAGTTVDILTSLSMTPALPIGYTIYRRIGSLLTDGSVHWMPYLQVGDEFIWPATVGDVAVTNLNTTATLYTLTVPTGVQVNALFRCSVLNGSSVVSVLIQPPDQNTEAVGSVTGNGSLASPGSGLVVRGHFNIRTNTSAQIRAVATVASTTFDVTTYGWVDRRGKN